MENDSFEFFSAGEPSDSDDFDALEPCPHCAQPIPREAITCYYCGRSVDRSRRGHPVLQWGLILLVLALFVLWSLQRFG